MRYVHNCKMFHHQHIYNDSETYRQRTQRNTVSGRKTCRQRTELLYYIGQQFFAHIQYILLRHSIKLFNFISSFSLSSFLSFSFNLSSHLSPPQPPPPPNLPPNKKNELCGQTPAFEFSSSLQSNANKGVIRISSHFTFFNSSPDVYDLKVLTDHSN